MVVSGGGRGKKSWCSVAKSLHAQVCVWSLLFQMERDYHSLLFIPTLFFTLCDSFVLVFAFVARSQLAQAFQ